MSEAGSEQALWIRNGDVMEELSLKRRSLLDVLEPRAVAATGDTSGVVRRAFDRPIGSPPLEQIAAGAKRVVIVCDDLTRPTPAHRLVPEVLDRLNHAGVQDTAVTILIANGTHRAMSHSELEQKLGPDVLERVSVRNHLYDDLENLVDLGSTASGVPITVNRLAAEADLVIGVGNIVPHRYCGWAGGAKIIQPGISGEATTAATHLMITRFSDVGLGTVDNTVRSEIESVGDRVRLRFIVNTVLNAEQEIVHVVAGDFRAAFRAGVKLAREVYGAAFREQADVVVASAYPSDLNLWQAGKSLYSAQLVVRPGGVVILASPCYEGVGEHGSFSELMALDYRTIDQMLETDQIDDRICAAAALACALVREHCEVWLAGTGISDLEAERMGMRRFETAYEALSVVLDERPDARVTLLHNATEVLPVQLAGTPR